MASLNNNGTVTAVCDYCKEEHTHMTVGHALNRDERIKSGQTSFLIEHSYTLLQCPNCSHCSIVHSKKRNKEYKLVKFSPEGFIKIDLPKDTASDVEKEFRNAEAAIADGHHRAGSALVRSTLEKCLKANGYKKNGLLSKIDLATDEGFINQSLQRRAHSQIKDLGDEILHEEEYRDVSEAEAKSALKYAHSIIDQFYSYRSEVLKQLRESKRIKE